MEALAATPFHLSSSLADFEASPLFGESELGAGQTLASWLGTTGQGARGAHGAALPWSAIYAALTSGKPLPGGLASRLTRVALDSAAQLDCSSAADGCAEEPEVASPEDERGRRAALESAFKLSLFFLHHLVKAASPADGPAQVHAAAAAAAASCTAAP